MDTAFQTIAAGVVVMIAAGCVSASAEGRDPVAQYRWASRVLLVSAPRSDDPQARAQRDDMASARAGSAERDLVLVEAIGTDATASALRRRFRLPDDAFRAVLIGKDGGAKLVSDAPIPMRTLFSTIDAMPMRRDEMKRR